MKNKGRDESALEKALAERDKEEAAHNATYAKLAAVGDKLAAERAAHEATDKVVEQLRAMLGKVAIIVHLHESSPEWQSAALCMREIRCLIDFDTLRFARDQLCLLGQRAVELSNDVNRERAMRVAAEARVAELERDCYSNGHGALVVALEALSSARELLENLRGRYADVDEWLRAHPATARPAATCTCGAESSGGPCLCTPAAPGAEPKDTCCVCGQPCTSYVCLGCENSGAGT